MAFDKKKSMGNRTQSNVDFEKIIYCLYKMLLSLQIESYSKF